MKVRVIYMAQLRRLVGVSDEEAELPSGSTLAALLRWIGTRHGAAAAALVDQPSLLVFRGDEQTPRDALLAEDDRVTLLTPMAGG